MKKININQKNNENEIKKVINYDQEFLDNLKIVEKYIIDELNINEIEYINDEATYINLGVKPNFEIVFKKSKEVKDDMITLDKMDDPELIEEEKQAKAEGNKLIAAIKSLQYEEIRKLIEEGRFDKNGVTISKEQVTIEKKFLPQYEKDKVFVCLANSDCGIRIDKTSNDDIQRSYLSREIVNRIQKLRQKSGIRISDEILVTYGFKDENQSKKLKEVCEKLKENIEKIIKTSLLTESNKPGDDFALHAEEEYDIGEEKDKENIKITIYKKK